MNTVDLARFEFDYDTTWAAFFLDADLNIYSRYGGRDGGSADARQSKESLLQTMQEVLETHEQRLAGKLRREDVLHPAPGKRSTPEDIPLLRENHQGCVHCHQVKEYRQLQAYRDGKFERSMLFSYPLPENLGLVFDRKHGHAVKEILPESAAAKAGLKPGDVVTRAGDVPVHSEQDLRWALHRAAEDRPVTLAVERPGAGRDSGTERLTLELSPAGAWKQTDLGWRKSLRSVPVPWGFLAYAHGKEERTAAGIAADRLAIRVLSVRGTGLAENVGLKKGDLIIAVAGRTEDRAYFDDFKSDLLRLYAPGDEVRLTVLRDGQTVELKGKFPAWQTGDTSVP